MANWRTEILDAVNSIKNNNTEAFDFIADKLNDLSQSDSDYIIQDQFTWQSGAQKFNLDFEALKIEDVFVNMKKLSPLQFDYQYNFIEILDTLQSGDKIFVKYSTRASFDEAYGITKDRTAATPDWHRIGRDMSLHASLPVQSKMKRCILKDDGAVNYYLDPNDSSKKEGGGAADLTGNDGQFVVKIPRHFELFDTFGDQLYAWISEKPIPGGFEVPEFYISAGKANMNRSASTLACVVNKTPNFRGGTNNSAWDGQPNSELGKPVTAIDRIDFHQYAKNRGSGWSMMTYEARRVVNWLITIEYATTYHQRPIDNTLTPEGYKKGGLGQGAIIDGINWSDWGQYNNQHPIFEIGKTIPLGNNSGEVQVSLTDFPTAGKTKNTPMHSYRGIESWWGDIWEWTDGVNIKRQNNGSLSEIFKAIGNAHSDNGYEGYKKIGELPPSNGYIKDIVFGEKGDILPINSDGASSTTYYTDYFYMNNNDGIRGLLFGASAHHGAAAGSFFVTSRYSPSFALRARGSRLCFFPR